MGAEIGGGDGPELAMKVAVTVSDPVTVVVHGPVPLQPPPLHPPKVAALAGVAVNVTAVPDGYGAAQVAGQSIPVPDTEPAPLPARDTVSAGAVPVIAWSRCTPTQSPAPVHESASSPLATGAGAVQVGVAAVGSLVTTTEP